MRELNVSEIESVNGGDGVKDIPENFVNGCVGGLVAAAAATGGTLSAQACLAGGLGNVIANLAGDLWIFYTTK